MVANISPLPYVAAPALSFNVNNQDANRITVKMKASRFNSRQALL